MVPGLQRKLINVLPRQIVSDVVIAVAVIAVKLARQWCENSSGRKLQKTTVRDRVQAVTPSVVDLPLQLVPHSLRSGQLQPVVVAVCSSRKLSDCAKASVGWVYIRKGGEASFADRLIAVDLSRVRLIHGTGTDVLSLNAGSRPDLMFNAEAPLHEVGRMEFAIGHGSNSNWEQAGNRIRECGRAGKLPLRETRCESLIGDNRRIDRAVGHTGRNRSSAHGSQKTALKCLHIGRVHPDQISNSSGQEITEQTEAASDHSFRLDLPRDCCPRLQDRQRSGREQVAKTCLDGIAERLVYIVGDRVERSPKACHFTMRIERIRIEGVPDANCPRQLPSDLPCVLRIEI